MISAAAKPATAQNAHVPGQGSLPMVPSSAELMEMVRSGDEAAEAALHRRFAPLVNGLVWKLLGPDPEHADVVHDVFIRIYRGLPSLRQAERLQDWIARVTANTVKNELRRRAFRRWVSWEATKEGKHPEYHPDLEGRELVRRAYEALEQLPVTERVVLSVRLFESTSIEDIANICGCSTRTAKRRLQAARRRFERIAARDPLLRSRLSDVVAAHPEEQGVQADG